MKIFITGGAGFIGSHLTDRLLNLNNQVVVYDNFFRGKRENLSPWHNHPNLSIIEGDIRDQPSLKAAMTDCEMVYHLAAQSNVMGAVTDLRYSFESNVLGTFNVLEAAKDIGIKKVIFSSSREVYGEASQLPVAENTPLTGKNAYGASKIAGEKYCEVFNNIHDLPVVIFRLANVYGTRDFNRVIPIFLEKLSQDQEITIFGGQQLIDFIYIDQVIDIFIEALQNPAFLTAPINIGCGQGTTLFALAERLQLLLKKQNKISIAPARSVEVVKFIADNQRLKNIFLSLNLPEDPLFALPQMINTQP